MALVDYATPAPARASVPSAVSVAIPIFAGAFLLFQIQPLLARRILPWFGGGASVWTACMLFFQLMLLGGYAYAHWAVRRLSASRLAVVHCSLLLLSLLSLPVMPSETWKPLAQHEPVSRILLLLTFTVGLPYFLLSSTSPILQAVFARRWPDRSPYRLFALSNAGSLLGLLAYPVMVEPALGLRDQAFWWSYGYLLYAAFAAFAVVSARRSQIRTPSYDPAPMPGLRVQIGWIGLPAAASVLLLAATGYVTQNVPPTPFLWILPLTAYLLSFIVAFDAERWYRPELVRRVSWLGLACMALPFHSPKLLYNVPLIAAFATLGVFFVSLYCHGETVQRKPHPAHLTRFYLLISAGGAAGGILVGAVSPLLIPGEVEYLAALVIATAALVFRGKAQSQRESRVRTIFAVCLLVVVAAATVSGSRATLAQVRSFYGSLWVMENNGERSLGHGAVIHGVQRMSQPRAATLYYAQGSGVQLAIEATQRPGHRVGLIGLGAGTLAAYGRMGDVYTFYEINPQVVDLARSWFTFLKDCPALVEVVIGDGRLALEREQPRNFDVLVVDAFSGDSIPVHLLTSGALDLYRRHLAPGGVLAFHISNSVLDLAPVISALANHSRMNAVLVNVNESKKLHRSSSEWALLSESDRLPAGTSAPQRAGLPVWTDDYSSLWPILR